MRSLYLGVGHSAHVYFPVEDEGQPGVVDVSVVEVDEVPVVAGGAGRVEELTRLHGIQHVLLVEIFEDDPEHLYGHFVHFEIIWRRRKV